MEAALSKRLMLPLGPVKTEAKAMEEGITFAWDVGVQDIIVESDSKIIIDAMKGINASPVTIDNILGKFY